MDKKSIAGAAFCGVLLVAWWLFLGQQRAHPPAAPETPAAEQAAPKDAAKPAPAPVAAASSSQPAVPAAVPAAPVSAPAPVAPPPDGRREAGIGLPGYYRASIDLQRGAVSSVELDRYPANDLKTKVVLGSGGKAVGDLSLNGRDVDASWPRVVEETAGRLVLERGLENGLVLRQTWEAKADRPYEMAYRVTVANPGTAPVPLDKVSVLAGTMQLPASQVQGGWGAPADLAADLAVAGDAHPSQYDFKKINKLDQDEKAKLAGRKCQWAAVHTKYFLTYLSGAELTGAELLPASLTKGGEVKEDTSIVAARVLLPPSVLAPGMTKEWDLSVYAGPKELERLRLLGGGTASMLQMDLFFFWRPAWMASVSRFILDAMIWFHNHYNRPWAYGLAIILITLVVKICFWPLTHYSTLSMKKMQVVQPLIEEIKAKFKDNPQLMQQKIMEVYREKKVNPLGGCLPMLLQIPVFFALYNVFRGAIELRHAPFLWVADLSQPDTIPFLANVVPIRPLAILTGVTMFLQQKVTPTSMDPAQARMMSIMTIFFAFIFYSMPSGLTLYWTVNQALSIVQTLITFRLVQQMGPHYGGAAPAKSGGR